MLAAQPEPIAIDLSTAAVLVIDMQNDFGSKGGMFDRAGTELDVRLEEMGIRHLIITGCTASICVESTVRDAMFRDYLCVLLADCMAEPIGDSLARSNHEATLLATQVLLGWVSSSDQFIEALEGQMAAVASL